MSDPFQQAFGLRVRQCGDADLPNTGFAVTDQKGEDLSYHKTEEAALKYMWRMAAKRKADKIARQKK